MAMISSPTHRSQAKAHAGAGLLLLGLVLFGASEAAAAPSVQTIEIGDPQHHLRQARHFLKRGWVEDAAAELVAARGSAVGQAMFEVWWLSSEVAWAQGEPAEARRFAREAFARAATADDRSRADAWLQWFDGTLGLVRIEGPAGGQRTRMQLEQRSLVFDPALQQLVDGLALGWRERVSLPLDTALPHGDYSLNGVVFTVKPGEQTTVALPMAAMGNKGLAALQVTRLELGAGVSLAMGSLRSLPPAPTTQVALTVPVGQALLGAMVDMTRQGAPLGDGQVVAPGGFSGGLRAGGELFTSLPLSIRPSAVLRAGQLPAAPLRCDPQATSTTTTTGSASWGCSLGLADAGELPLVARGFAWMPGAELVIEYREAGRTTALGAGLKGEATAILGAVPSAGVARTSGAPLAWRVDEPAVRAAQLRLLANLSLAF